MKKWVYYNENDASTVLWIKALIRRGVVPDGEVDDRDIRDVCPNDLRGFTRCHFFAGILGWELALQMAGWSDDRPVWTGSCPCQPFSTAGRRKGTSDERHLWPAFFWLISQCKPHTVMGEQVASKDALAWCDLVRTDLEGAGYAFGVQDTCAAGFGAPHIRQRLYWVGYMAHAAVHGRASSERPGDFLGMEQQEGRPQGEDNGIQLTAERGYVSDRVAHTANPRSQGLFPRRERVCDFGENGSAGGVDNAQSGGLENGQAYNGSVGTHDGAPQCWERTCGAGSTTDGLGNNNNNAGLEGFSWDGGNQAGRQEQIGQTADPGDDVDTTLPTNGLWRNPDWLWCRDKKWRPVKSGLSPLVDGLPEGVVRGRDFRAISQRLKGYGNAIVAPQAAEIIKAFMEVCDD